MKWRLVGTAVGVFSGVSLLLIVHCKSISAADCDYASAHDEMIACEELQLKTVIAELDKLYQQLNKVLNAKERKALSDAHRAWLAYRTAHCYSITLPLEPGSIVGVLTVSCPADLTKERVKTLRESFRYLLTK